MKVDLFEFARTHEDAGGELPVARLGRVETPDRSGVLRWRAVGSQSGREPSSFVDLTVEGEIVLVCQRCLLPMRQPIAIASTFMVVGDEKTAEQLDEDDDFDVIVGSVDFDFAELIEDEVILALPSAPKHDVCPAGATDVLVSAERPSPFAALAGLKTLKPGSDPGGKAH